MLAVIFLQILVYKFKSQGGFGCSRGGSKI